MRTSESIDTTVAILAGELRLTLIAMFADKVALTRTKVVPEILEIDLALGSVSALASTVLARIWSLAVRAVVAVCALALVVLWWFECTHAFVLTRTFRAHVKDLALCAAVVVRAFA